MYKSIIFFLVMIFSFGCNTNPKLNKRFNPDQSYHLVTVSEAKELIDERPDLSIIDVRTPQESAQDKIKGAVTINVKAGDFKDQINNLDKEDTYLLYCRTGIRSRRASTIMRNAGFKNIYEINGGFMQWRKEITE